MDVGLITLLLLGMVFFLFVLGFPISFTLAATGALFAVIFLGPRSLYMVATSMYGGITSLTLMAIPLFIFMGTLLSFTGIADDMFKAIHIWSGGIAGSLAMGAVAISAVFAAMCGVSGAATVTMGTIALPAMLERKYDKNIAVGAVGAGALLGIMIPPSVLAIIYASVAGMSIGRLYIGMMLPGILMALFYILYIWIRCLIQPHMGPKIPKEDRASLKEKLIALKGLSLPLFVLFLVLGGMYTGTATPTEAAGIGAAGVMLSGLLKGTLNMEVIKKSLLDALRLSSMIMWLIMSITLFSQVYSAIGAADLIQEIVRRMPVQGMVVIVMMQLSIFIMGMFMDDVAIILIVTPLYLPIVRMLGFNDLWFAVMFMIQVNIAWLTPPYGFNLFYMRAVTPPSVTMGDIYLSVFPFIGLQLIVLLLVMIFPGVALWLPNLVLGGG
ncbi:MAG: TRAP transporter large permease subunit [Deltaproteobacteria bacterium]|nr:TRAP transporter large permease subunit [Deltaproteobacteria bacterium]